MVPNKNKKTYKYNSSTSKEQNKTKQKTVFIVAGVKIRASYQAFLVVLYTAAGDVNFSNFSADLSS